MNPRVKQLIAASVLLIMIFTAVFPMNLAPAWNGTTPGHREQYPEAAHAFLEGHLDLRYGKEIPNEKIGKLENPYDPAARTAAGLRQGIDFYWDHAYYEGKYYMYFGVVPVILVFLPYEAVTGQRLPSYVGTQIFTALFIAGFFALLLLLRKRFFPEFSYGVTVALAAGFSLASVWYAAAAPALYCTAITSGLAAEVWSLFFFVRAVYDTEKENRAILRAAFGALFGALAFGCRPPVALANILVIPMLVSFLKERKFSLKLLGKLVLAALPYFVIGGLLLWYNAARFGNPLEFGQHYQLTLVDVSKGTPLTWASVQKALTYYLTNFKNVQKSVHFGLFLTFPILPLACIALFYPGMWKSAKGRILFLIAALVLPAVILFTDILGSPLALPRYRTDFTWSFALAAFLLFGFGTTGLPKKARPWIYGMLVILAAAAVVMAVNLFFCPYDANYASVLAKK